MIPLQAFKETYEALARTHSLPAFEQLDADFEIYDIFLSRRISLTHPLRNIARFMVDRYWNVVSYLHNFLAPNQQSLILMEEAQKFSAEERELIGKLMKRLTIMARKSAAIDLKNQAEEYAAYINELFSTWQGIKKELVEVADINLQKWQKETTAMKSDYYG